jgi:predicted RNA-binding protein (virulence factor B family)
MDWGMEKMILVPFRSKQDQWKKWFTFIWMKKTSRLVASSKTNQFLKNENITVEKGEEVVDCFSYYRTWH